MVIGFAAPMSTLHLPSRSLLALSLFTLAAGCGARSTVLEADPTAPAGQPAAVAVYAPDGEGCVDSLPVSDAAEAVTPDSGEEVAVVDLAFAQECTNAGGQYLLAREIDGFRSFWVGAHACQFAEGGTNSFGIVYGVVRYRITAGIQEIPPDVCVGFPDEPPGVQTDATTVAIAVFEQLSEAQAFAASL